MSAPLPPDLSRLGDQLLTAAQRRIASRRRRAELLARLASAGIAGALLFAMLTPGPLGPADRGEGPAFASAPAAAQVAADCDQPRLATYVSSSPCAGSSLVVLRRAHAWQ